MRGSDAQVVDTLRPVVLVVMLRDDDLRYASLRGGSGGARTTVVNDGCDAREERLLVDIADRQASDPSSGSDKSDHPRDTIARRPSARAAVIIT